MKGIRTFDCWTLRVEKAFWHALLGLNYLLKVISRFLRTYIANFSMGYAA